MVSNEKSSPFSAITRSRRNMIVLASNAAASGAKPLNPYAMMSGFTYVGTR